MSFFVFFLIAQHGSTNDLPNLTTIKKLLQPHKLKNKDMVVISRDLDNIEIVSNKCVIRRHDIWMLFTKVCCVGC